jgi:hypothetical protein
VSASASGGGDGARIRGSSRRFHSGPKQCEVEAGREAGRVSTLLAPLQSSLLAGERKVQALALCSPYLLPVGSSHPFTSQISEESKLWVGDMYADAFARISLVLVRDTQDEADLILFIYLYNSTKYVPNYNTF